jgi:hypothetical protein
MGGGFSGGGAAIRGGGGAGFAASPAMRGGGSFAGAPAMRGTGPVIGGGRVATAAPSGTWNRGNWNGGTGGTWNGGHWRRHGGFWPGVAAGAAIGALGSYAYYGSDPYYYGDPYYNDGYYDDSATVAVGPDVGGDAATYCAQRYRSYDPASGTYLGYDGLRHPCP